MSFGSRLKSLRKDHHMSQLELAKILGLSANTISQYESNKRFPDQMGIVTICRYFDISADYLLGLSNIQPNLNSIQDSHLNDAQKTAISDLLTAFNNKTR